MYHVQLSYPGSSLDHPDRTAAFYAESLFYVLESELVKAALALDSFDRERGKPDEQVRLDDESWEKERLQKDAMRRRLAAARGLDEDRAVFDQAVGTEVEAEYQRLQFSQGVLPRAYRQQPLFLFARAFLLSADMVVQVLKTFSVSPVSPTGMSGLLDEVRDRFPNLHEARNSSAHLEDRARGLGRGGKALQSKPYAGPGIASGGGGVLLENLEDCYFSSTLGDGGHGGVHVSIESLDALRALVQRTILLFTWRGFPRVSPT